MYYPQPGGPGATPPPPLHFDLFNLGDFARSLYPCVLSCSRDQVLWLGRWLLIFSRGYIVSALGWYLSTGLHDVTSQKAAVLTFELSSPAIELPAKNTKDGWW
jgi:hypothetical protein